MTQDLQNMKKNLCKVAAFIVVFIILFFSVQSVLHQRFDGHMAKRNESYLEEEQNSIDVLFFGTSEIYDGITPLELYKENGITSFNLASVGKSAIADYYQLLWALETQSPKVVVLDFASLYNQDVAKILFRNVYSYLPDRKLANQMLDDICELYTDEDKLSYIFPLLRFHSMWNELTEEDFHNEREYDPEFKEFSKGADLQVEGYPEDDEIQEITPDLWQPLDMEFSLEEYSTRYYEKIISLCREKGIQIVALFPPKISDADKVTVELATSEAYFAQYQIPLLNYNTYEKVTELGLTLEEDYWNSSHLNIRGARKFSISVADTLDEMFDLPDHRGDPEWDAQLEEYEAYYQQAEEQLNND